jgi:hypothetical protein
LWHLLQTKTGKLSLENGPESPPAVTLSLCLDHPGKRFFQLRLLIVLHEKY